MKRNNTMNGTYFGPDSELSKFQVVTEDLRTTCPYGGWCGTCMYGICAASDCAEAGKSNPQRCRYYQITEEVK